jgi:hypothetical protein
VTPDERERMAILCERIAKEQDRKKFAEFVQQLNDLLDTKDRRLASQEQSQNSNEALPGTRRAPIPLNRSRAAFERFDRHRLKP